MAAERNHIPSGHPEGLTFAFANSYHGFMADVLECVNGHAPEKAGDYLSHRRLWWFV